jgi:hypothetical protein
MLGSTGAHRFSAALGPTGDFRLRNAITTLKAMLGAFALFSASAGIAAPSGGTDGAQPLSNAVVQADVLPSIEILPKQLGLAGRCNGLAFDVNTFINTTAQTSPASGFIVRTQSEPSRAVHRQYRCERRRVQRQLS